MPTPITATTRTTALSLASNAMLAAVKWTGGILGNSNALIADAIESTADILGSLLVLLGLRYANRPADKGHPYGHGRIEPLITFVVVGFLVTASVIIARESIAQIRTPHLCPEPFTLLILAPIIIWKEVSFRLVMRQAQRIGSTTLKAEAWHHRSDAITSVAAFIGIGIALLGGPGWEEADDWAALFASGVILYNSYRIFRPAFGEMMDEAVYDELVARIRTKADEVPGVRGTEKCHVRKSGTLYHIELHLLVDGSISVQEGHRIAHAVQDHLRAELAHIGQVLVHVEPG